MATLLPHLHHAGASRNRKEKDNKNKRKERKIQMHFSICSVWALAHMLLVSSNSTGFTTKLRVMPLRPNWPHKKWALSSFISTACSKEWCFPPCRFGWERIFCSLHCWMIHNSRFQGLGLHFRNDFSFTSFKTHPLTYLAHQKRNPKRLNRKNWNSIQSASAKHCKFKKVKISQQTIEEFQPMLPGTWIVPDQWYKEREQESSTTCPKFQNNRGRLL